MAGPLKPHRTARMPSRIESTLPSELKLAILESLPDFKSMCRLVEASKSFHNVYRGHQEQVLISLLCNYIDPVIQSEVTFLSTIKRNKEPWWGENLVHAREASEAGLEAPSPLSDEFTELVRFHNNINDLTQDLSQSCFELARAMNWTVSNEAPRRRSEVIRIQRALYRIEIWYALSRLHHPPLEEVRDDLLLRLSAWELDELGCVYDYIATRIARVREDVSEAHLEGEDEYYRLLFESDTMPSRGTPHWVEHYFIGGLDRLNSLVRASQRSDLSVADRCHNILRLCSGAPGRASSHGYAIITLSKALTQKPNPDEYANVPNPLSSHEIAKDTPVDNLDAEGPNAAWLWAHTPGDRLDWYQTRKADLGEWCASIWDEERIRGWGQLQGNWSIDNYKTWAPMKREQNILDRRRRMMADPDKPKLIPCRHRLNTDPMPPDRGLLFYRGRTETKNHAFSTCPLCFEEIRSWESAHVRPQVKVVRYGGVR